MRSQKRSRKTEKQLILQLSEGVVGVVYLGRKALTALFIFTLPLLFYIKNTSFNQTKATFAVIVISSLFVLWGLETWLLRKQRIYLPALFFPGLAFISVGALSLLNAASVGTGFYSLILVFFFFLFYLYMTNAVRTKSDLGLYIAAALLAVLGSGLYGLLQYEGWMPGHPEFLMGEQAIISSFGNKNFLAEFINSWLFPSFILLVCLRFRWSKAMVVLLVAVGFAAFFAAGSVGAWLSVVFALIFLTISMVLVKGVFLTISSNKGWFLSKVIILVLLFLMLVTPGFLRVPTLQEDSLRPFKDQRISQSLSSQEAEESMSNVPLSRGEGFQDYDQASLFLDIVKEIFDRIVLLWESNSGNVRAWDWWIAYEMFRAHPWLGIGLGNYKVEFLNYKDQFVQTDRGKHYDFYMPQAVQAHNDYVQLAAEMGIWGIVALSFVLITLIRQAFRQLKFQSNLFKRFAVLALYSGVLVFCVDALVNFPGHLPTSALNLMLLLGLAHSVYLDPSKREHTLKGITLRVTVIASAAIAVAASILIFQDWQADVYLDEGNTYLSQGYYRQALGAYERSLALTFHPEEVLFRIGGAHYKLDALNDAETYFERSLSAYVMEDTFWNLAVVKLKKQDYEATRYYLNRLLAIKPRPNLAEQAQNVLKQLSQ